MQLFNPNDPERIRLLEILKERSYKEGNFTLASGKKSDYYLDCRPTALSPEGITLIGSLFFKMIQEFEKSQNIKIYAAGGMTLGADPLASAVALTSYLRGREIFAFIVRKEEKKHGAGGSVVGAENIPKGSNVVILEDVVTSAGSAMKAIDRAKQAGMIPVATFAIADRNEGGKEALAQIGIPLYSLFVRNDFRSQ